MTIEPKLMSAEELAEAKCVSASAFTSQSFAGLEANYESMCRIMPALLAHIAAQDLKIAKLEDELRSNGEALRDNFIGEDDDEHNDLVRMGSQMIRLADGLTP